MKPLHFLAPLLLGATAASWAASPIIDTPNPANVPLSVPIGKALLLPITATDADGDRLTYTVKSDKANVRVRVRTGHPKLKMTVSHAAGAAGDPAFNGAMEFAVLRDFAPIASEFMMGFAQAPYFTDKIFHRIANLNPTEDADGSFIFQGGDAQAESDIPNAGKHGVGFFFENEFRPWVIFSGRGQFAMANSGFATAIKPNTIPTQQFETYRATNGSQFFITAGHPRHLDFNHTIWAQMLRGWDLLPKLAGVATYATQPDEDVDPPVGYPKVPVRYSASIEPNFSDAILLITATGAGAATITVTANDGNGGTDTKSFPMATVDDTFNSPPFVQVQSSYSVAKDKPLTVPFKVIDLEHDYVFPVNEILKLPTNNYTATGVIKAQGNPVQVQGNVGFGGQLDLGVGAQQYDMTFRSQALDGAERAVDDRAPVQIAVGDKAIKTEPAYISAAPGAAFTNTTVATFVDTDALARTTHYAASINWGDGSTPTTGTIIRNPTSPLPTAFAVTGTHTYANPGTYPLVVDIASGQGNRVQLRGLAVITNGPLRAFGRKVTTTAAKLKNGIVATFKDDAPVSPVLYSAKISWGDGTHSDGVVRKGPAGDFQVLGTHTFPDPEDYAVVVRIHKSGMAPTSDAYGWSFVEARGFKSTVAHLPPFSNPNLIGQFTQNGGRPLRQTTGTQTYGIGQFITINAGNKATTTANVRFFLSEDTKVNTADETIPDPNDPTKTITNPKDLPVLVGAAKLPFVTLPVFPPGGGLAFSFDSASNGDGRLRFPVNENGGGLNLLARYTYPDPLGDHLPIERVVVFGPYDPFSVTPTTLTVQELSTTIPSAQFKVKLTKQPRTEVKIAVSIDTEAQKHVTIDKTTLTFTSTNWNTEQAVTVTAKDDNETGDHALFVRLAPADASTGTTDVRFDLLDPADVLVFAKHKTQ